MYTLTLGYLDHEFRLLYICYDLTFALYSCRWPVVLGSIPGGIHWIRLLFVNLFLLGIDSAFSIVEALVTCVQDTERFRHTKKWKIAAIFCIGGYFLSLLYATDAGLFFRK